MRQELWPDVLITRQTFYSMQSCRMWLSVVYGLIRNIPENGKKDVGCRAGVRLIHHQDKEPNGLGVSTSMGLSHYSEVRDLLQKLNMTLYLRTRHDTAQYHFLSASCEMARSDSASALEYADTARRTFFASGANLDQALTDAGLAQICFECGQAGIAADHLESALELASITRSSHRESA